MTETFFCGMSDYHVRTVFSVSPCGWKEGFARNESTCGLADICDQFETELKAENTEAEAMSVWNRLLRERSIKSGGFKLDRLVKLDVPPHHAFALMARPMLGFCDPQPAFYSYEDASTQAIRARAFTELESLVSQLRSIAQTTFPKGQNLKTYGTRISQVVISACILIENLLKSSLQRNGYSTERYSTADFVQLKKPLKLDEYTFRFHRYPWMRNRQPFSQWDLNKPTSSIGWYKRYNSAKHNAFNDQEQPTLQDGFDAIGACYIVLTAMFGLLPQAKEARELDHSLAIVGKPIWKESESLIHLGHSYGQNYWNQAQYFI